MKKKKKKAARAAKKKPTARPERGTLMADLLGQLIATVDQRSAQMTSALSRGAEELTAAVDNINATLRRLVDVAEVVYHSEEHDEDETTQGAPV